MFKINNMRLIMKYFISMFMLIVTLFTNSVAYSATVSWYGGVFHGRLTSSGEKYNQNDMTCASNSHKIGTKLLVTNPKTNKSVVVRVNDTGGFSKYGRTLDLSKGAFSKIAPLSQGTVNVTIKRL